jgi:hypothetical protein
MSQHQAGIKNTKLTKTTTCENSFKEQTYNLDS